MIFAITTKQGGQCVATVPDVCKTPAPPAGPVPMPYPNMGDTAQATASTCTKKVKIEKKAVVHKNSEIPKSQGDEPGTAGGVISGKNMGEITFKKFSTKVKAEGQPVVYQTCITGQNGKNANAVGIQASPSQQKVKVMC